MKEQYSPRMIRKILLEYAVTFMFVELADSLSMVVDGLVVSRGLGPVSLAATGLASPSYQMALLFSGLFAVGIQSQCSAAMSAGDRKSANRIFSIGCVAAAVISVVLFVLGFVFLDQLCLLLGANREDPELYTALREYLRGWLVGTPGFIGFTVLSPLVTLDGNKKCTAAATIVQSTINIVGDILAVTVLNRGVYGVGLFTGIGFDVALVMLVLSFTRKHSMFRFELGHVDRETAAGILKQGLPRLTKYGCKLLAPILINRTIIAVGGSVAMAAMSVKSSIGGFCYVAGNGIAESIRLMTQVLYSEKDSVSLRHMAGTALIADSLISTAFSLILLIAAPFIAGLYIAKETAEFALTVTVLRCLALSLVLNGFNSAILSYLQGARKVMPANLQTVSHRLVFLALCTFILGRKYGIEGLFAAIPLSELLVLICYVCIALFHGKDKKASDALLLLPEDFSGDKDDSLIFSIHSADQVVGISEAVGDFCRSHGIDRKRSYYASLCVEEMAGNVVEHGFTKDNKPHSCDIRVMIEGEDIVLRIRDDCWFFDLKERYKAIDSADITSNIGIRLVHGIAKDISYVNLIGTNTLIIRV